MEPPGAYDWRGAATRRLVTTIWYPAAAGAMPVERVIGPAGSPLFALGRWADAPPWRGGRHPLIVVSHGTGGSAQMMAWLAADLAARGYIVAAVNHPGNNALEAYTAEGFLLWWERARDVTVVVDGLLRSRDLAARIDRTRIGAAGFSLGGYTVLALAGARTDPERWRAFCRSPLREGCEAPPEFPNLFARWSDLESRPSFREATRRAGRSYRDGRIRAVFAIAPALGPALIPESLAAIRLPVAIVSGADDRVVPVTSNARAIASRIPDAMLTLVPGAGHYTFLAPCTQEGRARQPLLCGDAAGVDRGAVHRQTVDLAARFFATTLR
jgi:predicted dienelactone hydrolase